MNSSKIKVQRIGNFASFVMENGIGVAIDFSLEDSLNGRYIFKTTNMRIGSVQPNKELIHNDILLIKTVTEHFEKFLNFKKCHRTDSRIDKFSWFIKSRVNLYTDIKDSDMNRAVLYHALKTIKLNKDPFGALMFSIEEIDGCIKHVISQNLLVNNKRLIS